MSLGSMTLGSMTGVTYTHSRSNEWHNVYIQPLSHDPRVMEEGRTDCIMLLLKWHGAIREDPIREGRANDTYMNTTNTPQRKTVLHPPFTKIVWKKVVNQGAWVICAKDASRGCVKVTPPGPPSLGIGTELPQSMLSIVTWVPSFWYRFMGSRRTGWGTRFNFGANCHNIVPFSLKVAPKHHNIVAFWPKIEPSSSSRPPRALKP